MAMVAAGALAALALAEIAIRVLGIHAGSPHIIRDPNRGWRHRPHARVGAHRTNALGYAGDDFPIAKPPGEVRVLCMGDSCTFGEGVGPNEAYPAKLAALLQARLPRRRIRVINAGVNGYSSHQGLQWFRSEAVQLAPEVVTIFYGWNDHWLSRIGGPDKDMSGSRLEVVRCALSRIRLFEFGVLAWHRARRTANMPFVEEPERPAPRPQRPAKPQPKPTRPLRVSLIDYEANLRAFVALCRSIRAEAVLMTAPSYLALADVRTFPESARDVTDRASVAELQALHESYNAAVRKVARAERVPLVDLCAVFAQASDPAANFRDLPRDFVHPSAEGFGCIANALADVIAPILRDTGPAAPAGQAGHGRPAKP